MKVLTIFGTRPEVIRLNIIINKLDQICDQILVHTGQNYDHNLDGIFMKQLGIRKPDYYMHAQGTFAEQIAIIMKETERILLKEKPDRFLVLGDTNSSLAAIIAKRMGVPVYHMEAGNRCFDDRVPEEVNRRLIDHSSDILMPYTYRSRENLIREGINGQDIFVTGNPIKEVLDAKEKEIDTSPIKKSLGLVNKKYFLVTLHREENVDIPTRLVSFVNAFDILTKKYNMPLVWSVHPRTRKRLMEQKIILQNDLIKLHEPFGLFEFVHLEKNAFCVLTDSGTVQEECCIYKIPTVTVRDVTERPETLDVGSSMLSGAMVDDIIRCVDIMTKRKHDWMAPKEYLVNNVSDTVIAILMSHPFFKYS